MVKLHKVFGLPCDHDFMYLGWTCFCWNAFSSCSDPGHSNYELAYGNKRQNSKMFPLLVWIAAFIGNRWCYFDILRPIGEKNLADSKFHKAKGLILSSWPFPIALKCVGGSICNFRAQKSWQCLCRDSATECPPLQIARYLVLRPWPPGLRHWPCRVSRSRVATVKTCRLSWRTAAPTFQEHMWAWYIQSIISYSISK